MSDGCLVREPQGTRRVYQPLPRNLAGSVNRDVLEGLSGAERNAVLTSKHCGTLGHA